MNRSVKRLAIAICFPLLSLWQYWTRLDDNYNTTQLLLASSVAIVVATIIFLYAPIAKKVERGSPAWVLGLLATLSLGTLGFIYDDTTTWGWPVLFFAIWMPVVHVCCKHLDAEVKWSFFKAPRTS